MHTHNYWGYMAGARKVMLGVLVFVAGHTLATSFRIPK